jgi:hypothetical protein
MKIGLLDGQQRIREKAVARAADDLAIKSGQMSVNDMRQRNEFLHDCDMASSKIEFGDRLPIA